MKFFRWLTLASLVLITGCVSQASRDIGIDKLAPRKAEQTLSNGIHQYEDGELKAAQKSLQEALNLGLAFNADKVSAHKYLAFIYCASSQSVPCRDEFRRAFEIDPTFKLDRTEIGHPLWGPVYNSVRAELVAKGKIKP